MKIFLKSLVIVSMCFISCKNEPAPTNAPKKLETTTLEAVVGSLSPSASNTTIAPDQIQPKATEATPNSIMRTVKYTAVPVPTAKEMNPPHGQPNHRCDIAVGAPLNSKPVNAAVTSPPLKSTVVAPQTVSIPANAPMVVTPTVVTAAGMNPPHGQEGHRCDVAVGAELPK